MATTTITLPIVLNGTGTEIPSLLTTDPYDLYLIRGTAVAIGNYAIVPTGTPGLGLTYNFRFIGSLDITTNTKTFSLFGVTITQEQLNKNWEARCFYNGIAWEVILEMDFTEAQIVSSTNIANNVISSLNLANGSVTTPKLANLAVTTAKLDTDAVTTAKIIDDAVTTSKIVDDGVTTSKILDSNITTSKLNDLSVTTAKIDDLAITTAKLASTSVTNAKVATNAIDTTNIINNAVTNAKLANGTASSVKIINGSGAVQDLTLALNQFPISDGTTVIAKDLSTVKYKYVTPAYISLESGSQPSNYRFSVTDPSNIKVIKIEYVVINTLAGTDSATIDIATNYGSNTIGTITIAANTPYSTYSVTPVLYTSPIGGLIEITATKTTPGGAVMVYIHFEQI